MERDYSDEFEFLEWDQSYETFVKMWDQNQDDGYLVFTNFTVFEALMRCLLDPLGTYLLVLEPDDGVQLDEVTRVLQSIWKREGVFRIFVLFSNSEIYTWYPFARNGTTFGTLVNLFEIVDGQLPDVPRGDFAGYPLVIEMFGSTYSSQIYTANGTPTDIFVGADVIASRLFAKKLNFTPIFLPPDSAMFGQRLPNGTFDGAIGRLTRHVTDIAFVGFFIKDYFSRDIEFTSALYTDEMCCLVKKASRIPEYLLPVTIFPTNLWSLLFAMGLVSAVAWVVVRAVIRWMLKLRIGYDDRSYSAVLFNLSGKTRAASMGRKIVQIVIDTYILLISGPYYRFTRSGHERLILVGIMMVSLIFVSMFTSGLASVFVNPLFYKDIDSLEQLDKSGYDTLVKYRGFLDDVFPANYSPLMESLRKKMIYAPSNESALGRVVRMGNIATVTRKSTLTLDNAFYLTTKQLHMVSECPRLYNLAYVVQRHWVLLDLVNDVLLRMLNGGLINHWIAQMDYNTTLRDRERTNLAQEANFKVLTLVDVQFPMYILAIGLVVGFWVFVGELVHFRYMKE
ncbi:uncharacterized protein LOC129743573 [Uranotaenia lowii]|uniref:uncharacterized protein LOC129743573 n=1 Tax=Uranotaenia lowii TaxID=190385 RepID=UPI00247957C7|nr:uncharacterized protein LOC129743573 [Uranotaenia lowii]